MREQRTERVLPARAGRLRDADGGPTIGMLWGDFPWEGRSRKVGKLLSMGAVGRTTTRALRAAGRVEPFTVLERAVPEEARRAALERFLTGADLLFADVYGGTRAALELRHELGLRCPAILFAGGAMAKGADAMLFPWQHLLRPGDGIWFTSRADQAIWRRLVRRSALREWVAPLGVDETLFRPRTEGDRLEARRRHGLPASAPLLLAVGRLNVQKNLHTLLLLLAAVRERVPDARLCVVGEEDDIGLHEFGVLNTGYAAWLRTRAADLGVGEAVTFAGPQFGEDLARLYAAADVLVSASVYHRENFGLAPAEAQACGVPVVCSAWNGFRDVVRHGETGYLMDAVLTRNGIRVDWASGAAHVVSLLTDGTRRADAGARAAAWAHERFGMPALERSLGAMVKDALSGNALADAPASHPNDAAGRAYEPSAFARRYESHKRACGWYGATPQARRAGSPRMFQGRDYRLYVRLMEPFASITAEDLDAAAIAPRWIPYCASPVALDEVRRLAEDRDPIWPHRRYCAPLVWDVLCRVDGRASVGEIADRVVADGMLTPGVAPAAVAEALRGLHADGFILFRPVESSS
ncbi:MAG: hypothetical protein AVDCRST_MAG77-6089 [uncultured Chloroflexi bacterium]|uniref:Glycosyl transferase family 1 domain-containing protein n=1 Tax=uncultured Chloroflexota bacterium TaxID=166587 RepID=A0A6J4KJ42_9CHLR|nr:MAG: hypothetical protein AVDCRST_MAG77-6089 [uncultured Chloroflexota bacterium]